MSRLDKALIYAGCKYNAAKEILRKKNEGASHFVEILVAIIIVIAVGLVFKNQIISFITTVTTQSTTEATNLFK